MESTDAGLTSAVRLHTLAHKHACTLVDNVTGEVVYTPGGLDNSGWLQESSELLWAVHVGNEIAFQPPTVAHLFTWPFLRGVILDENDRPLAADSGKVIHCARWLTMYRVLREKRTMAHAVICQ